MADLSTRTLDMHVSRIRAKLKLCADNGYRTRNRVWLWLTGLEDMLNVNRPNRGRAACIMAAAALLVSATLDTPAGAKPAAPRSVASDPETIVYVMKRGEG